MESQNQNQSVRHLAHDLNNILTRILNSVELLKKKFPDTEFAAPLLTSIENGTYMASEIIEDVISESSNKPARKRKVNLNALISDLVNSISAHMKDRIIFDVDLAPELPFIEGRYTDFYRVIMNLIVNATEAIKETGRISVRTQLMNKKEKEKFEPAFFESGNIVQLKISDNGSGIDKSIMPYIFDENFSTKSKRAKSSIHSKNGGFGLTIVKKIIENNNGIIKVTSELNNGTEFTICLPAVAIKNKNLQTVFY